jgi:hypothetical protein
MMLKDYFDSPFKGDDYCLPKCTSVAKISTHCGPVQQIRIKAIIPDMTMEYGADSVRAECARHQDCVPTDQCAQVRADAAKKGSAVMIEHLLQVTLSKPADLTCISNSI